MFNIIKVIEVNMVETPTPGLCIFITLIELLVIKCDGTFSTLKCIGLWLHIVVIVVIIIFLRTVTGITK